MRLAGSAQVLEARRQRALALVQQGMSLNAAARRIGCAASSVIRWLRVFRHQGRQGLAVRRASGRPPRLPARYRPLLLNQLLRGAMAHGYPTDLWTTRRIAEVIERRYGVRYHPNHVSKLLHSLGWSPQKPERRARERDEAEIARRKRPERPRVRRTPSGCGPTSSS